MATAATIAPEHSTARARARPAARRRRRWRLDIYIGISYIALLLRISTVRTQYLVLLYGILQNAAGLGPHRIQ